MEPFNKLPYTEGESFVIKSNRRLTVWIIGSGLFLAFLFIFFIGPISGFDEGKIIKIKRGQGLKQIGTLLEDEDVIFSNSLFDAYVSIIGKENNLISGSYYFERGEGIIPLASRLVNGRFDLKPFKITIPEGFNSKEIAERIQSVIPDFDKETFLKTAKTKEGYLYPETYFFMPDITPDEALLAFSNQFESNTSILDSQLTSSGKSENQIMIMASLLEEEVKSFEDKKIVAGILWHRIDIGMALQVDATLAYITGKESKELTLKDLKIDSPYNSYTNLGLPPTPISNPGLDSIKAALVPTETDYLYFLTDKNGIAHYAKTFEDHKKNKEKYLR